MSVSACRCARSFKHTFSVVRESREVFEGRVKRDNQVQSNLRCQGCCEEVNKQHGGGGHVASNTMSDVTSDRSHLEIESSVFTQVHQM